MIAKVRQGTWPLPPRPPPPRLAKHPRAPPLPCRTQVDADSHRSIGEKFGVQGFPTIKFFPRGKAPSKENAKE